METNLPEITSVYFDPTTDFGFKKLFGEEANKDLLMDFLNSMLPSHHQIATLTLLKTEQLPDHAEDRKTIFDVYCEDATGKKFVVEMQKARMTYVMDRSIYYTTFPIQAQAIKGKWNFNLVPVYLIGVLNFEYDLDLDYWKERQLLRTFSLLDNNDVLMTDDLHFMFLQLPYFSKRESELVTHFEKWCYFLKNLETFDHIPNILNEPIFMKALDVATISNMDHGDYILYQISKSKKYDMEILEDEAEERGMERGMQKGMQKGLEKGLEKGKTETEIVHVLTIHHKGYSANQISDLLTIPLERVLEIIEKHAQKEQK
jgi:predicted transposase/invertase (TIGR01784 family)